MHCMQCTIYKLKYVLLSSKTNEFITLFLTLSLFLFCIFISGCTSKKTLYSLPPPTHDYEKKTKGNLKDFKQQGIASWYGPNFHGKKTANGEKYNMYSLTAAHRFLPFNSQVVVTNLNNQKNVAVRINDRGPFVDQRIIDLSYVAAKRLGMIKSGVAPVQIRTTIPVDMTNEYYIQVGSFLSLQKAEVLKQKLINTGYKGSRVQKFLSDNQTFWRVQVGIFHSYKTAKNHLLSLKKKIPNCFIIENSTQP